MLEASVERNVNGCYLPRAVIWPKKRLASIREYMGKGAYDVGEYEL